MRYSSMQDDPGYANWARARFVEGKTVLVFLDGAEQKHCTTADEEEGFIVRAVPDENGGIQIDPENPEQIWEERVSGQVEVRLV